VLDFGDSEIYIKTKSKK